MKDPNTKTYVAHSKSKSAWNIKRIILRWDEPEICSVHYPWLDSEEATTKGRIKAFEHAEFISWCLNNSTSIMANQGVLSE
jgi:hypothetical protein